MQRSTRQRAAIMAAFSTVLRPLSPQDVLATAGAAIPGLGIATVYRNLRTMIGEGILQTVELPGQVPMYELKTQEHHHHFQCTVCHRVFDVHQCPGDLSGLAPKGFVVESHAITLYVRCSDCRKKPRSARPSRAAGAAARRA